MFNLSTFYNIVSSDLSEFGIIAKDKASFIPKELTDSIKIIVSDVESLVNDYAWFSSGLGEKANKIIGSELITEIKERLYAIAMEQEDDFINERKYYLDLAIHNKDKTYIGYIVEQLRLAKYGYKNCLVMSNDYMNYDMMDEIISCISSYSEYESLDNGDVMFYDKGVRYNIMQATYSKIFPPIDKVHNKLTFIFYDKCLASLTYNSEKNILSTLSTRIDFIQKNRLEFLYELDFAKHKVVHVEIPLTKK